MTAAVPSGRAGALRDGSPAGGAEASGGGGPP